MKIVPERIITFLEPADGSITYDRELNAELCETLEEVCDMRLKPNIIVDMKNVDELHAEGLGQLMAMYAATVAAGGYFALCGLNANVYRYLGTTKADLIFRSYQNRDHALHTLGTS